MVICCISLIYANLVKYPIWGYYSGIRASILDQLAGFQFSVATILVRRTYESLEEAHLWELHWWDFRAGVLGN